MSREYKVSSCKQSLHHTNRGWSACGQPLGIRKLKIFLLCFEPPLSSDTLSRHRPTPLLLDKFFMFQVNPQANHPLFVWCNDCLQLETLYSRTRHDRFKFLLSRDILKSPFNLYVEIKFQGNVD